jgi:plastocyanin
VLTRFPALVGAALVALAAGCGGEEPQGTTVSGPSDAETSVYDDPCSRHGAERRRWYHVTAEGFRPRKVIVGGGTPVTFVNCDDEPHTVTKASGRGEKFDSGTLQPRERFDKTFVSTGEHRIVDRRNPGAEMIVEVRGSTAEPQG